MIRLPAVGGPVTGGSYAVMIPTGVSVIELSIKIMEPTDFQVAFPVDISMPFWQLLMEMLHFELAL
jgi:hypothetical protein